MTVVLTINPIITGDYLLALPLCSISKLSNRFSSRKKTKTRSNGLLEYFFVFFFNLFASLITFVMTYLWIRINCLALFRKKKYSISYFDNLLLIQYPILLTKKWQRHSFSNTQKSTRHRTIIISCFQLFGYTNSKEERKENIYHHSRIG